jgi:hypothetical protein
MPLKLNEPPGYCDLPDAVLTAEEIAYAIHAGRIAKNGEMGMVRPEIFAGFYLDGQQVILPTSDVDGYNYSRDELIYFWTIGSSANASTGWLSNGVDGHSLWFTNWDVQQYDPAQAADSEFNKKAGTVHSEQWYRRSGDHLDETKSNDGILLVFTIAQRLKNQMRAAAPPSWANIDETTIVNGSLNEPWTQTLAQTLNENAKRSILQTEVFYLGEYTNGQTVNLPTSQVDQKAYSAAECKFMAAWRWTASGARYAQPPEFQGQLGPFFCSISPSGVVSVSVSYVDDLGLLQNFPDFGRVAVFAFCTRAGGPTSLPLANKFQELDDAFFWPGKTLKASTVLAIKKNIDEAELTPEFFGPTVFHNGDIVPLPVSPIDGYAYKREELQYIWYWSNTTNQTGSHLRLPLFDGRIINASGSNASAYAPGVPGQVVLHTWRLPPGGPYVDDNNNLCTITVLVIGFREAQLPELFDTDGNVPDQPPVVPGTLLGAAPSAEVDLAPSGPGDFTVAHGFGGTPALVLIQMTSGGNIWFRGARYDGTSLYLTASDGGVTGKALLFDTAPAAEVALAPAADGDFAVPHSLGAAPGLVLVQMTSGGNIWGQQPTEADASLLYLTASGVGLTANAELWLSLNGVGSPSLNLKEIAISASAPGNFTVPHQLGIVPKAVLIRMNSPGFPAFWFQTARYDDVNIYLVSPGAGVSGFAEVLY